MTVSLEQLLSGAIVVAISAIAVFVLLFPVRAILLRLCMVDRPNARSSHTVPTVRGGGVAMVVVLATAIALLAVDAQPALWTILAAFMAVAGVSFADDLYGLKPSTRLAVQLFTAGIAVYMLVRHTTGFEYSLSVGIGFAAIAAIWIAGYTNAFNFMDGINGIAGVQALTTGFGTALVAVAADVPAEHPAVVLSLAVAGAAIGFLPHNFPYARVFMGDVGSAPLGFLLAVLAFWIAQLTSHWMLFWLGLLHANFVLDTGVTLVRRARHGDQLSKAHRDHFYQRWVRAGKSHPWVTFTEFGVQVIVVLSVWGATGAGWLVRGCVASGVVVLWGGFFLKAENAFRNSSAASAPNLPVR